MNYKSLIQKYRRHVYGLFAANIAFNNEMLERYRDEQFDDLTEHLNQAVMV